MIPLSMLRIRVVWCGSVFYGLFIGMVLTGTYYLPIYFQAVKGVSPITSGVWVLPIILTQLLAAVLSGFLSKYYVLCDSHSYASFSSPTLFPPSSFPFFFICNFARHASLLICYISLLILLLIGAVSKLGYYLPFGVASGILAAVGNGLFTTFTQSTTTGEWIGYQIVGGVGRGLGMQIVSFLPLRTSPLHLFSSSGSF